MLCVPRGVDSSALQEVVGGSYVSSVQQDHKACHLWAAELFDLSFNHTNKTLTSCAHSRIPSNKPLPVGYMHNIVRISTEKEKLLLVVLSSTIRAPHSESLEQRTITATPATTSTASTNHSGIDTCTATRKPSGPSSPSRRTGPTPPAHSSPCLSSWSRWW